MSLLRALPAQPVQAAVAKENTAEKSRFLVFLLRPGAKHRLSTPTDPCRKEVSGQTMPPCLHAKAVLL